MLDHPIKLIVGLGNPGPQHESNRHNAGVIFLHHLCRRYGGQLRVEAKFFGEFSSISILGSETRLLFPTTFMNNSGKSVATVCKFFKISKNEMLSSRRSRYLVRPRQIGIFLTKTLTSKSLPEIGREFSNRDHTTIIHSVKTIEKLKEKDPAMVENINKLKNCLLYTSPSPRDRQKSRMPSSA